VLVAGAWASNVTPHQLSALSKRVTKLEQANARLAKETRSLNAAVSQAAAVVDRQKGIVGCLRSGWNSQETLPFLVKSWTGFQTTSGEASFFTSPAPEDGLVGTGYLITTTSPAGQC
jgi:hypothetical protein